MSKRKNIRMMFPDSCLNPATLNAVKQEEDRQIRLKEKNQLTNSFNSCSSSYFDTPTTYSSLAGSVLTNPTHSRVNPEFILTDKILSNSLCESSGPSPSKAPKQDDQLEHDSLYTTDVVSLAIEIDDSEHESSSDSEVSISHVSGPLYFPHHAFDHEHQLNRVEVASGTVSDNLGNCVNLNNGDNTVKSCVVYNDTDISKSQFSQSSFDSNPHHPTSSFKYTSQTTPLSNYVSLLPHLINLAKPHQLEGLKFLYDNIIEDFSSFNKHKGGFGCILAHSMGLGKTFQSISFIEIFLRSTASTHVLVIVPVNTLHNWTTEFDLWLPSKSCLETSFASNRQYRRPFKVVSLTEQERTFKQRFNVLTRWKIEAGVLIIGYELFRTLVGLHLDLQIKGRKKPKKLNPHALEVFEILCDPGPDLVICDEGHRIKNEEAAICQAIKSIRTRRRVMLTGYPLQNNLLEYWCMIDFVRPNYLGNKKEFRNLFLRPIENGQCQNSMPEDVRIMLQRTHVLHHMLSGIVQRKSEEILAQNLPHKLEFVIFTSLSQYQSELYDVIVNDLKQERSINSSINPLLAFAICCKIWNHPDILFEIAKRCSSASDLSRSLLEDEEEFTVRKATSKDFYNLVSEPQVIRNCFSGYEPELLENGPKFQILFDILETAVSMGEKLLVFSQSIPTLNLLEMFLHKSFVPNQTAHFHPLGSDSIAYSNQVWKLNHSYLRLDGSSSSLDRHNMISDFNDSKQSQIKLFLISTRAGSLGINLVAASRIIILDVSWNPCHDAQAVCRSYRFGQKRECFVYRLIADGTFESKMYKRQISKISTSDRVLDQLQPERVVTKEDIFSAITSPVEHVIPSPDLFIFARNYTDPIIKKLCMKRQGVLTKPPLLHESFFYDSSDDHMNEKEQKEASELYLNERELCRLREVNSREMSNVNSHKLRKEYNGCGSPQINRGIEEERVSKIPKRLYIQSNKKVSTPNQRIIRNFIGPIFEGTSPISITDSEDDLPSGQIHSKDLSPFPSPPYDIINLIQTPEFTAETCNNNVTSNCPSSQSIQDPFIIILDSPTIDEPAASENASANLISSYDVMDENDTQFFQLQENSRNNISQSQNSSLNTVEEMVNLSDTPL